MITQELKQLVVDEALKLREHATKEEKDRLQLENLKGDNAYTCLYGLMTRSCYSDRANELKILCAIRYSNSAYDILRKREGDFSAIEVYINMEGAKIADLVNLIKS